MWICNANYDYIHCVAKINHAPGRHVWDWRCKALQHNQLLIYRTVKNRRYQCKKQLISYAKSVRFAFGETSNTYMKLLKKLKITDRYVTSKRK